MTSAMGSGREECRLDDGTCSIVAAESFTDESTVTFMPGAAISSEELTVTAWIELMTVWAVCASEDGMLVDIL
jgi:hypothetical protein